MKINNRNELETIINSSATLAKKRNMIANIKNYKTNLGRMIYLNYELDLKIGQEWDNFGEATSWMDAKSKNSKMFVSETSTRGIAYVLEVDGVEGYQVQYFAKGETDELDELAFDEVYENTMELLASDGDMGDESEVLVPAETKMIITDVLDGRDDEGLVRIKLALK